MQVLDTNTLNHRNKNTTIPMQELTRNKEYMEKAKGIRATITDDPPQRTIYDTNGTQFWEPQLGGLRQTQTGTSGQQYYTDTQMTKRFLEIFCRDNHISYAKTVYPGAQVWVADPELFQEIDKTPDRLDYTIIDRRIPIQSLLQRKQDRRSLVTKKLIFPIYDQHKKHYSLAMLHLRKRQLLWGDSLDSDRDQPTPHALRIMHTLARIWDTLCAEQIGTTFNSQNWTCNTINIGSQTNTVDCAQYVCNAVTSIAAGQPPQQVNTPDHFRCIMATTIAEDKYPVREHLIQLATTSDPHQQVLPVLPSRPSKHTNNKRKTSNQDTREKIAIPTWNKRTKKNKRRKIEP